MSEICPVILIVDDTPENLLVLAEMLKSAGWQTRDAGDGSTALEQMVSALPDLILLDVMMPGIDGFETCKRIKQDDRFSSIPVIFMTALDEVFHKVQGFDAGAVDYITKPFYHDEVIARVRTHLKIVQMQKQIEQQNALKDRFMQIAAHDLRNPLTSIQLAVDLLLHMLANPGRPNQMLSVVQSIASTTRRMNHLIGSFLDHRKAAANRIDMDIGALDLPSLACAIADNHRSFADKKNIRIDLLIPDQVPLCSGDENRSHQIITNLLLAGTGRLDAAQGNHTVTLPVEFAANAIANITSGAGLTLSGALSGNQALTKEGDGTLTLTGTNVRSGTTTVSDGTLAISSAQLNGNVFLTTGATLQLNFAGTDSISQFWLDGEQKWKGAWGGSGSGADYETAAIGGTGMLTVTNGPEPGYDGWAWQNGLTGAPGFENAITDNPDNDSLPNVFEWILGGNPLAPDSPALLPQLTKSGSGHLFTFSREDSSEAVVTCVVQYSTNLSAWADVPIGATSSGPDAAGVSVEVIENGASPDSIIVTLPPTVAPQMRLFLRLKAQFD